MQETFSIYKFPRTESDILFITIFFKLEHYHTPFDFRMNEQEEEIFDLVWLMIYFLFL